MLALSAHRPLRKRPKPPLWTATVRSGRTTVQFGVRTADPTFMRFSTFLCESASDGTSCACCRQAPVVKKPLRGAISRLDNYKDEEGPMRGASEMGGTG